MSGSVFSDYNSISNSSSFTDEDFTDIFPFNPNAPKIASPPTINKNHKLRAELISIDDYPTASKVISAWANVAQEKAINPLTTDVEKDQFNGCRWISNTIVDCLTYPATNYSIYACKDTEGNIQGAMVLEVMLSHIYIDYLVTNPINIRSAVNQHELKKVTGAGTCLLHKAEEVAIQYGKETIRLTPLKSAINFYLKNGFSYINYYMVKTVNKIHDLITDSDYKIA
jgi:hypothetical protein